jgi:hypothetical protein
VREFSSRSDLLGELLRQELVVLRVKLVQIFWHWLVSLIVQRTEGDNLGGVSKDLDSFTGWKNNLWLVVILILRKLVRLQFGGRARGNDLYLGGHCSLNGRGSECLKVLGLIS